MSTRSANTLATPVPDGPADSYGPDGDSGDVAIDTEPERAGYLATRWLRPGEPQASDWTAESDMARARLTRQHRRLLGQVVASSRRRE